MVEVQSRDLIDFHAQSHLSPAPCISLTLFMSTQLSERERGKEQDDSIPRKS